MSVTANKREWSRLDNVGNLFPAVQSDRITGLFRLSAVLDHVPLKGLVQEALDRILPRFSYFNVEVVENLFWHTFIPAKHPLLVLPDTPNPNLPLNKDSNSRHPLRVRLFQKRLSVEFHHSLTDGTGAMAFLRALLAEYFALKGLTCQDYLDIPRPGSTIPPEEYEDSYSKLPYDPEIPLPSSRSPAFQHPGKILPKGEYRAILGILPLDLTLARAKARGLSLTEFLIGVYFLAWQEVFFLAKRSGKKTLGPIRMHIPVNLRRLYPSSTHLNFFLTIPLELDPRLGQWSDAEVFEKVHHFMQIEVNPKSIRQQINANLRGVILPYVRVLPLFLKKLFLRLFYHWGEKEQTSALSNMGQVKMPKEIEPHIHRFEFLPPPSPGTRIAASVISYQNVLCIGIGRIAEGSWVEAAFFRRLREYGLPVKIETNLPKEEPWRSAPVAESSSITT